MRKCVGLRRLGGLLLLVLIQPGLIQNRASGYNVKFEILFIAKYRLNEGGSNNNNPKILWNRYSLPHRKPIRKDRE